VCSRSFRRRASRVTPAFPLRLQAAPAPTVALAHGVLRQLLTAAVAGAAAPASQPSALSTLLAAASLSPSALQATFGVSPHHGGRGKWVALAALDAAVQALGATATAASKGGDDAEASLASLAADVAIAAAVADAPSAAASSKKSRKGSLAAAPLALTADVVTSVLSALLAAASPVLRDEWRAVTGALAALTETKRAAAVAKAVRKAKAAAQAAAAPAVAGIASQAAATVADAAAAAAVHAASTVQPSRLHAHSPAPGTGAPVATAAVAPPAGGDEAATAPSAAALNDPHRHLYVGVDEQPAASEAPATASASEPRLRARGSLLLSLLHRCATGTLLALRVSGDADAADGVNLATPLLVPTAPVSPTAVLARSLARTLALLLLGAHPSAVPFESLAPTAYAIINGCYPRKLTDGGVDAVSSPRSPLALLVALVAGGPAVLPPAASLRAVQLLRASIAAATSTPGADAAPRAAALVSFTLPPLFALLSTPSATAAQADAPLVAETRRQALAAVADVLAAVAASSAASKATPVALLTAFYGTPEVLASGAAPAATSSATAALVAAGARLVAAGADVIADAASSDRVISSSADSTLPGVLAAHAAVCVASRPAAASALLRLAVTAAASTAAQQAAVQGVHASPASAAALVWTPVSALIDGAPAYVAPSSTRAGHAAVLLTALTVARAAASDTAFSARLLPLALVALRTLPHAVPLVRDGSTSPSGESAPLLPAALAVVTPALWTAACAVPAAELAVAAVDAPAAAQPGPESAVAALAADASGGVTGGDLLLARLIALIERGPAPASTAARAALASLGGHVTPAHLARYLRASGLVAEAPTAGAPSKGGKARRARASSVSGASAEEPSQLDDGAALALVPSALRFRHALAVGRKLHALLRPAPSDGGAASPALSPAEVWVGRATLVAEVAASALGAAAASGSLSLPDAAALVGPVSSLAEVLLALPEAAPVAASAAAPSTDAAITEAGADSASAVVTAAPKPSGGVTWSDEDLPSACEYGLQAALGVLQAVAGAALQASSVADDESASSAAADGFDVDLVLAAVRGSSSLHTRGAALGLLGSLARLAPGRTLNRLLPVLLSVGSSALPRDDAYTLSLLAKLVGTVVPPLAAHGRRLGVSVHGLLHVFALCAPLVSPHRQGGLYGALLASVASATTAAARPAAGSASSAKAAYAALAADSARYLPSLTALLLAQPVLAAAASGAPSPTSAGTSAAALAALPSLCGSLFKPFSPAQQVDALASLIATAHTLLRPASSSAADDDADGDASTVVSDASGDAGSDDGEGADEEDADPSAHLAAALSRLQSADARELAPLVVAGRSSLATSDVVLSAGTGSEAVPAAALAGAGSLRFRVGTALLDFVGAHLKSRPFLLAAAATSSASDALQPHFLLLAERLFDVLSEAADGRERAVTARAAALAAARAANETATAALSAPSATAATAAATGSKKRKSTAAAADPAVAAAEARATAAAAARSAESLGSQARFWGGRYEQAYALLGSLSGLVAPSTFVTLISALLGHPSGAIRRRSLAFLNEYLRDVYGSAAAGSSSTAASIGPAEAPLYLELLGELTRVVAAGALPAGHATRAALLDADAADDEDDDGAADEGNAAVYAQVALDTVALLGAYLGRAHPAAFAPVIGVVMEAVRLPLPPASAALAASAASADASIGAALAVRSSALLCVASLAGPLGPRLLPHLPALMPAALGALEWSVPTAAATAPLSEPAAALRLSVLAALTRLVEALPSFVHPYLPRLLPTVVHPAVDGGLPLPPRTTRYDRRVPLPGADEAASAAALVADTKEERAALPLGVPASAVTGVLAAPSEPVASAGDDATAPSGTVAALPFSLAHAAVSAPPSSAALATALLGRLTALVAPRLLLPPLLGAWGAVSAVSSAVRLTRAVAAVLPRLSKKEVKEHTPRLLRFVMTALDGRWRSVGASDLVTVVAAPAAPGSAPAAAALAASAATASVVEAEVGCLFAALALRLSEASLRPLLLRLLTWGTSAPEDIRAELLLSGETGLAGGDDDEDGGSGSGGSLAFAHAALARRIALFRLLEGLTAVTKSLALPFYGGLLLPEVLRELNASAGAVGGWNAAAAAAASTAKSAAAATPAAAAPSAAKTAAAATAGSKRKAAATPAAPASSSARKRVRFAGAGDDSSDDDNDDSDDEAGRHQQHSSDEGSDADEAGAGPASAAAALAAAGAATSVPYAALFALDGAPWSPPAVHEPATGGPPHALVPTTPHGLRCVALGCLKAALHHDAASTVAAPTDAHGVTTGAGLLARGGRDRLEGVLRTLTACFELPLAATAEEGEAVAAAPAVSTKKGGKKATAATPAPAAAPSAATPVGGLTSAGVPGGRPGYDAFVAAYLIPAVGAAVTATGRDALWKPVVNACLLLTRDARPRVRLAGLRAAGAAFAAGGDAALVLLPEALPFLGESVHDGDGAVEAAAQGLLGELETRSGEDLQQYLA
jgi:trimeric autotransporter adhesin